MSLDLSEMMRSPLPATLKGLATTAVGRPLESIGNLGLRILEGDLPFPVAILKESALVTTSSG